MSCPCGLGADLPSCCGPYLAKEKQAPTAEALMRSRYSAFVLANVDYIIETTDPKTRKEVEREETERWSKESVWQGLEIVRCEKGAEEDSTGIVEFIASFKFEEQDQRHHETAEFSRRDGVWYFLDGRVHKGETHRRETPKVGRNDPCPCASGKKYKKCCGKAA